MKKLFKRTLLLLAAVMCSVVANAQMMPPIPVDTAVIIGKLDNGLTYYIRHNETPKGQADFYIAQKVGSALEEDNQRGLAHFLEHMCFNGTENFPGNSLIDWLESIGVKFGRNLNAYTSIDETVYNISNVPVARQSVQDSVLIILHDWADGLLLDPEEIDKERGVIHQEWRRSMVGQMRILENLLPTIYPGNRYGERLPIGTMEVVDNFPPQAIRDYYETWYRPDQQGIIVVGDIDPAYIEAKIKEIFSPIKMPENAKERVYFPVDDNEGTIYAIGRDKEMQYGIAEMMFKTEAFPNEMKDNAQYLIYKYMLNMMETMLDNRLTEIAQSADAPFSQAGANFGEFFVAKTKDALTLVSVAKGDDVRPGLEAAYRELLRAQRGGFTVGEYERARAEYLSRLEKAYENRNTRESGDYVREYVRHFIDNEPIPSVEDEFEFMSQIAPMIPVEAINQLLPELITPNNRVLLAMMPENDTFYFPTQEELAAVIAKVDAEDIEPYKDEMRNDPIIPSLPAPGKVVSTTDNAQWGAKELTLSNGVKVIVKPTTFKPNQVLFEAIALGGTSTIGDDHATSLIYMPLAMSLSGLGDYSNTDLSKYLQGKQANVDASFSDYSRTVEGNSTVKDLPTLMELIYATFTEPTIKEEDFVAGQNRFKGIFANQENTPEYAWQRALAKKLYKSAAKQALSTQIIDEANREDIQAIAQSMLANAADFTFIFVGDIDMDTFVPMVEQYIATLPADAKNAVRNATINLDREGIVGSGVDTETFAMQTPQTYVYVGIQGEIPYTPENKVLASVASQILSKRLLNKIREEMGAVYSIGAGGDLDRLEKYNASIYMPFPMKPELKEDVLNEIHRLVYDMTENIADDELNPIKEYMVKNATEAKEKNENWLGAMVGATMNGVDTFNDAVNTINKITTNDVKAYMKALLDQNNYRVLVLDPAE